MCKTPAFLNFIQNFLYLSTCRAWVTDVSLFLRKAKQGGSRWWHMRLLPKYFGILLLYALLTFTSKIFISCMPLQCQIPDYLLGTFWDVQHFSIAAPIVTYSLYSWKRQFNCTQWSKRESLFILALLQVNKWDRNHAEFVPRDFALLFL